MARCDVQETSTSPPIEASAAIWELFDDSLRPYGKQLLCHVCPTWLFILFWYFDLSSAQSLFLLPHRYWMQSSQWWRRGVPGSRVFTVPNSAPLLTLTSGTPWTSWESPTAMKPCQWTHVRSWIYASAAPSPGTLLSAATHWLCHKHPLLLDVLQLSDHKTQEIWCMVFIHNKKGKTTFISSTEFWQTKR